MLADYFEKSRAYLIGIRNYAFTRGLNTPLQDIEDLSECLLEHEFEKDNIVLCKDASKKDIEDVVERMIGEIGFKDRVLFYFAGHGMAYDSGDEPRGFLIPMDAKRSDESTFVDMGWLAQRFSRLRCKHLLIIFDCCFAGSFRWADNYRDTGMDQTKKLYRQKFERFVARDTVAWQAITSAAYDEEAIDMLLNLGNRECLVVDNRNSPFAAILIQALKGQDNSYFQDGIITTTRLYDYIDLKIDEFARANQLNRRQSPGYFPLKHSTRGQFLFLVPQLAQRAIASLPLLDKENPYKGLSSFTFADSHLYFGRSRVIDSLVTHFTAVAVNEVVLISGASGIGKSSLVMAGLIPKVLPQFPDSVKLKPLRPGNVRNKPNYLQEFQQQIDATAQPFILFVDQFEEMITDCSSQERGALENFIMRNLSEKNSRVVACIRSDFEAQLSGSSVIQYGTGNRFVVPPFERGEVRDIIVQPAWQAMIQFEADDKDDKEATQFIDRICDEAMQSPGSLPLLSFALEQWYKLNLENAAATFLLKEQFYKGIGGVNGALQTITADFMSTLRHADEEEKVRRLLLRLVTIQDDKFARIKVFEYQLDVADHSLQGRSLQELLAALIEIRIVVTNRFELSADDRMEQIYYELAHDSVVTSWKKLWEWLTAEKLNIPVYQQLSEDTEKWRNGGYKNGLLWSEGENLAIVRSIYVRRPSRIRGWAAIANWLYLTFTFGNRPKIREASNWFNSEERKFILKSLLRGNRSKARLNMLYVVILIVGIVAAIIGANERLRGKQLQSEKDRNTGIKLGLISQSREPASAYEILRRADNIDPEDPAVWQHVFNLYQLEESNFDFLPTNIIPLQEELRDLRFVGNGTLVALNKVLDSTDIKLSDGTFIRYNNKAVRLSFDDMPNFQAVREYHPEDTGLVFYYNKCDPSVTQVVVPAAEQDSLFLMISPDGIRLAKFLGSNGIIRRDTCLTKALPFSKEILYGSFVMHSTAVLLICRDNGIYLADFSHGSVLQLIKGYRTTDQPRFFALSEDKTRFAAVNSAKNILVWSLDETRRHTTQQDSGLEKVYFDLDLKQDLRFGTAQLTAADGRIIPIWLFQRPDDYATIVAHNSKYDEFVVYQRLPDRYYLINDKSTDYRVELPPLPNVDVYTEINFSMSGDAVLYATYGSKAALSHSGALDTVAPDSILLVSPSLKKLNYWLHHSSTIISDTLRK